MTIQSATAYFILGGKAREAIELYQKALGATVHTLQRFGDVDQSCPEAHRDLVMHAELRIGKALIMLSDGPGEGGPKGDGAVSVALDFDDESELRRSFDGLAAKGQIIEPIFDAPWGAWFGVVVDAFGISWMCHATKKPS